MLVQLDGTVKLIDDERTGYLIYSDKPKDYAEKVLYLLENERIRRQLGENGRAKAERMFSIKNSIIKIEQLYNDLLQVA